MVFLDETGSNLALTRRYGRGPKGARVGGAVPSSYGPNVTVVGALGWAGVTAACSVVGPMDGAVFRVFVEQILAPTLHAGDVVVLDNLSTHKVAGIREAIEQCGARLLYLPPYSPDLNPIEQCWSKLKARLRTVQARTVVTLEQAITEAFAHVTPSDAQGWFHHSGYSLYAP